MPCKITFSTERFRAILAKSISSAQQMNMSLPFLTEKLELFQT